MEHGESEAGREEGAEGGPERMDSLAVSLVLKDGRIAGIGRRVDEFEPQARRVWKGESASLPW